MFTQDRPLTNFVLHKKATLLGLKVLFYASEYNPVNKCVDFHK